MKTIIFICLIITLQGCADSPKPVSVQMPKKHWEPNEWVLTLKDQRKVPDSVIVFHKKDKCLTKAQAKGSEWTCVGVDPD
jgi:type IV pilus biogenesis protein CpaD/CtpE